MGTLLRCLLCRPCCPCCELRPPCPCCPHSWPPSGLQLRQRLSFCLSDHPWSCPCCHPRHRRSLRWCRPLRRQLLEPSMLPRGRLRLSPTTEEDTTGSDTTGSDTAMATDSTVKILMRGCLRSGCNCAADILSLDWVKRFEMQNLEVLYLASSVKFIPHGSGEVQHSTF